MADPLADALNRISANPQAADTGQPTTQRSDPSLFGAPPRWQRVLAATLPEVAGSIAAAPTNLYSLLDLGSRWAFNAPLPGGEGAREISESIQRPVREFSNRLAGEPIQDNLLSGDPLQVGAAWLRLGLGAGISAPVGAARNVVAGGNLVRQGVAKATAGSEVADRVTTGLGKALEVLTPITITTSPSWKTAAANIGVAGAIGAGVEAALGPGDQLQQAITEADGIAAGASDAATQGAKEIKQGQQLQQAGFITGNDYVDSAAAFAIGAAALWGAHKRGAFNRVIEGVTRQTTGYNPLDATKSTQQSLATRLKQQHVSGTESIPTTFRNWREANGFKDSWDQYDRIAEGIAGRHGPAVNTRMRSMYRDGTLPDSTVKLPAVDDLYIHYNTLTPQQKELAGQALIARQELDARQTLLRGSYNMGPVGSQGADQILLGAERSGVVQRHHMWQTSSQDLRNLWDRARNDPEVAKSMDTYLKITSNMRPYMSEQRYRTRAETNKMAQENPNYVPTRMAPGNRYMNRADQKPQGGLSSFAELGNPYEHLPKYLDEVVRGVEGEKIKRDFLLPMLRAADRGDAFASKLFGRRNLDLQRQSSDLAVHYRDAAGVARNVEVKDAVLRNALQGVTNPTSLQMQRGMISAAARLYESGSVGAISAATGSVFFPITSAFYATTFGTATRPRGVAAGWIDKALQNATGGKFGMRGDPTLLADALVLRAPMNLAAIMVDRMARVMHKSVLTNGTVARAMGPQTAKAFADALERTFKRSGVYDLQQRGLMGPASFGSIDPSRAYNQARAMMQQSGVSTEIGSFIGDLLHAISSAPAMSMVAMNKGKNATKLNYAIRNLSGDPGRSGAFKGALGEGLAFTTNATPWGNIFIQNIARLGEAFRRDPVATSVGIFNSVGLPAIMATLWNASQGAEYADYQTNQRTPDKQAASVYLAVPGRAPNDGIELPIDPTLRVFKHASELVAQWQLGLLDGSYYDPSNSDFRLAIEEMTKHRQMSFGEKTVPTSIVQQSIIPPMPPPLNLVLAANSISPRGYLDSRPMPETKPAGFTEGEGRNPQGFMSNVVPAQTEDILKSIGSQSLANIWRMFTETGDRMQAGASLGESMRQSVVNQAKMRYADSTKSVGSGPLFDTFLAISPSTEASGALVQEKLNGMRKISEAFQSGTGSKLDFVGTEKRGLQPSIGRGNAAAPDLETAQIGEVVKGMYQQLSRNLSGINADAYTQRQRIQNDPKFSPEMKRELMNEQSAIIIQNNRKMLQDIQRYEAILSYKFGREIKFDSFKLE